MPALVREMRLVEYCVIGLLEVVKVVVGGGEGEVGVEEGIKGGMLWDGSL